MYKINVIEATPEAFDYITFPNQNPNTQQYIQSQLTNFSDTMTDAGREFMMGARQVYEMIQNSDAAKQAKHVLRKAKGLFKPNIIIEYVDIDEVKAAQPIMQRYIMAQPDIRKQYHRQLCDGYSDTYIDMHPGMIGHDHYDYQRVMSNIIVELPDDDWKVNIYAHEVIGDDKELSFEDKVNILHTWEIVKMALEADIDPTDPWS